MLILIICISVIGIALASFLGYVGVDSVLQNKKKTPEKPEEQPKGLYRVRSYSFAYKKEEEGSPTSLFSASLLYPSDKEENVTDTDVNKERR